jgi:hypothetical protein
MAGPSPAMTHVAHPPTKRLLLSPRILDESPIELKKIAKELPAHQIYCLPLDKSIAVSSRRESNGA